MHDKLDRMENEVKKLEKRKLNEEQQENLAAFKVFLSYFQKKRAKGLAFTKEDEAALDALEIILGFMVKDASVT